MQTRNQPKKLHVLDSITEDNELQYVVYEIHV